MMLKWLWRVSVALALLGTSVAQAGSLVGRVTGDVRHLPWRKEKETLGWVSVCVWQNAKLIRVTRTHMDGTFHAALRPGTYDVELGRPAFRILRKSVTVPEDGEVRCDARLSPDPDFGMIVEPRAGMSEFCLPGDAIPVKCCAPQKARDWAAELRTDYLRIPAEVEGPEGNGTLRVHVPKTTPPGLYHLSLRCQDGDGKVHATEQPRVVSVLASYPKRFRVLMHKDWHFNWYVNRPGASGEVQADYFRAAGLLNALWISLGDDIGFEGDDHMAMFWHMLRHECRTPVFLAFGNHDAAVTEAGLEYYLGPPVQVRRIGSEMLIVRSLDLYQGDWFMPEGQAKHAASVLADASAEPGLRVVFLAGHQRRWRPPGEHFELPSALKKAMALNSTRGPAEKAFDRLFLHSFSVMSMHGWGGLHYTTRIVDVDLERSKVSASPEIILPSVTYAPANNGTATKVTATISARGATEPPEKYDGVAKGFTQPPTRDAMIPYGDLSGVALRFVMPKGRYKAAHGAVLRQTDAGAVTLVDVRADVADETVEVTVQPE